MSTIQLARRSIFPLLLIAAACMAGAAELQVAEGRSGMVVSGHPDATAAGVEILRAGGNAIDAAVAVSLALGVAEPYGSGLGGKLVLLYHDRATGQSHCIEALDRSARLLDVAAFRKLPEAGRSTGVHSVCVPGLPAGIMLAHETWGRMQRANVVAPAIRLARNGFEVLPGTVTFFRAQEKKLKQNPELRRLYLPGGELPVAGTRLPNEDLARSLEAIAETGAKGFYSGVIADLIAVENRRLGGPIDNKDLANYRANASAPIQSGFGDTLIVAGPPPTTGGSMLTLTLRVLEGRLPDSPALRTPYSMDRILRAYREVNSEVWQQIADTSDARERLAALGSAASIRDLQEAAFGRDAKAVGETIAAMRESGQVEALSASTTHFVIVDADGNVVSATQSLSHHFGSGVVAPGTGFALNNSMSNFSVFTRDSPNVIAPEKRPRSTITPVILLQDGRPVAAIGIPGAARIPTAMIQILLDVLFFKRSFADSIADTRWHLVTPGAGETAPNIVHFEPGAGEALLEGLVERGWKPEIKSETEYFGGINAIEIRADGTLIGLADLRRTNAAAGY